MPSCKCEVIINEDFSYGNWKAWPWCGSILRHIASWAGVPQEAGLPLNRFWLNCRGQCWAEGPAVGDLPALAWRHQGDCHVASGFEGTEVPKRLTPPPWATGQPKGCEAVLPFDSQRNWAFEGHFERLTFLPGGTFLRAEAIFFFFPCLCFDLNYLWGCTF